MQIITTGVLCLHFFTDDSSGISIYQSRSDGDRVVKEPTCDKSVKTSFRTNDVFRELNCSDSRESHFPWTVLIVADYWKFDVNMRLRKISNDVRFKR